MTSLRAALRFHRVHRRRCTFISAESFLRMFRSYYEVWENAATKWFVVVNSSYQRHRATSLLLDCSL
jgi:hypothetical protein